MARSPLSKRNKNRYCQQRFNVYFTASLSTSPNQATPSASTKVAKLEDTPVKSCKRNRVVRQRQTDEEAISIDADKLEILLTELVESTEDCSVETLLDCHSMLYRVVFKYRSTTDRQEMLKVFLAVLPTQRPNRTRPELNA